MTWQALMKEELERLRQADIPEADSDIRLLAMDVAGCTYSTLILRMAEEVTEKQAQRLHAYVTERMTHKPCQYILGTQEFMGYEFATAEEVLIPRPETELLVEEACRIAENWKDTPDGRKRRVLDLCCGSGCIGISFSKLRHGRDLVELADISDAAIALTKKNRERLQADCAVIQTDLFMQIEGKYDMIVSNPPYIRTDEIPKLMAGCVILSRIWRLTEKRMDCIFMIRLFGKRGSISMKMDIFCLKSDRISWTLFGDSL